ncbi:phage terminase small subunit P27 family [Bradyrhizobium diazoefficiens]|uniref:Terminase n=1 Tax=Bradyrhizobium diazoefficiens TaxID=1355477 RepID=A0A809ZRB2_9BRAD|nr:phage terminase small subunit P27 family [Bradyrhizobium diazoefficiens]BBZ93106.1 terminase [Bradyrhizobium diazoefficiens]BCA10857.1 terminase [Bradyrhizobium diazoefficiens]BCE55192.1 terminase [Bradyrhizobium diazoefficiens]BCE63926.1 terminase [Bradyrhizobium diazoefficiens]
MTTTGRRPLPTHLKLLRGNPGQRKLPNEPQPEQLPDVPEPPPFITGYAADEWWITGTELHRMGLLTKIDCATLAAYCHAYGQWRMAAEALARMAANDPVMNGQIIKTKYGDAAANPLVNIARKHAGDMVRYAAEFGLTPAARSRISATNPADSSQSKFAGLIAG